MFILIVKEKIIAVYRHKL